LGPPPRGSPEQRDPQADELQKKRRGFGLPGAAKGEGPGSSWSHPPSGSQKNTLGPVEREANGGLRFFKVGMGMTFWGGLKKKGFFF